MRAHLAVCLPNVRDFVCIFALTEVKLLFYFFCDFRKTEENDWQNTQS